MDILLARRQIAGSNVVVAFYGRNNGEHYYTIDIDGTFYDGAVCTPAQAIDALANPFNVKRVISQNEHYDAIDRDFEHCYTRV